MTKSEVRKRPLTRVSQKQSQQVCEHLKSLIESTSLVGLYIPFGWEPDLRSLWKEHPSSFCFPTMIQVPDQLVYRQLKSRESLKKDLAGVMAPDDSEKEAFPELILLPGRGFDRTGCRVGSGRGIFDRYLAQNPGVSAWGVCTETQIIKADISSHPHDIKVKKIITEKRIIHIS